GHRQAEPRTVDAQRERGVRGGTRAGPGGGGGRVENGLEREQQGVDAQLTRARDRLLAAPAAQLDQNRLEGAAAGGELVRGDARRRVQDFAADHAGPFELAEPLRQDVRADRAQAAAQLAEPFGPEDELADDQQRPPVAYDVKRAGDPAGVVVAPGGRHDL